MNVSEFVNPLSYVVHSACVSLGFWLLWIGIYYYLSNVKAKRVFALVMFVLACAACINYFFFGEGLGIVTTSLIFENGVSFPDERLLMNVVALVLVVVVAIALWHFAPKTLTPALAITLLALLAFSLPHTRSVSVAAAEIEAEALAATDDGAYNPEFFTEKGSPVPLVHLSRTGKNVMVLFLDRAISAYLPYLLQEKPELNELLDGFTYYPNTLSFGRFTVFGSSAIYGGYDYSVAAIDSRSDVSLAEKHNEALLLMPQLLSEQNYRVTLFDPPLVDHKFNNSDFSLFDGMQNVEAHRASYAYSRYFYQDEIDKINENFSRNLCFYGLLKISPLALQSAIYDDGHYYSTIRNYSRSWSFLGDYSVLAVLKDITEIDEGNPGAFLLGNTLPHNPDILQLPNYEAVSYVDNSEFDESAHFILDGKELKMPEDDREYYLGHYHVNMASLLRLGEWFNYLRDEGVYDNTRIVIVADHGAQFGQFDDLLLIDGELDVEGVNPLFMYKDYDAHGPIKTDMSFMTNADTPALILEGVVENPVNPYTGNPIDSSAKDEPQLTTTSGEWDTNVQSGNTFDLKDGHVYTVHDNIFEEQNWARLQ